MSYIIITILHNSIPLARDSRAAYQLTLSRLVQGAVEVRVKVTVYQPKPSSKRKASQRPELVHRHSQSELRLNSHANRVIGAPRIACQPSNRTIQQSTDSSPSRG